MQRLSAEQVTVVLAQERSKDGYNCYTKFEEEKTWLSHKQTGF